VTCHRGRRPANADMAAVAPRGPVSSASSRTVAGMNVDGDLIDRGLRGDAE
jgi:hypothetical protein